MKFLKDYKLFENQTDAKSLLINPTSSMRSNYNNINKAIDIVCTGFGLNTGKELLREIAMVETRLGTLPGSIRTTGTRGRGPWQIDEIAYQDIISRGSKELKVFFNKFKTYTGIDLSQVQWNDCNQFLIGCAFARLIMHERGIKDNIKDRADRAIAWKKYYNTVAGKGTPQKYWQIVSDCNKALAINDPLASITYNDYIKEKEQLLAAPDTESKVPYKQNNIAEIDSTYVAKKPYVGK